MTLIPPLRRVPGAASIEAAIDFRRHAKTIHADIAEVRFNPCMQRGLIGDGADNT
jgi:hypothetical protein